MKILERVCPLCARTNPAAKSISYAPPEWPMKTCAYCNMVYLEKAPKLEEMFENRAWEKTSKAEEVRREKEFSILTKFSKLTRKRLHLFPRRNATAMVMKYAVPGNILDVGCGDGATILKLPNVYVPYGIEISSALSELGRPGFLKRGGCLLNNDALSGLQELSKNMFSGMIMRAFLEHVTEPLPVLQEAYRTLSKGGILVIKVPNYASLNRWVFGHRWCGFRFPDHVNYFTPKTLEAMVIKSGLAIQKFTVLDKFPTSDNIWMVAIKDV
ncbi:MAG: class I SAM-dependent methyltransferase [Alphaproteobacteria bacterium]|nr:class I SAM-dependent methyltransferase [Alphaproteobacteria bacterium]MCK5658848.1 class I SAM-dependent methyltransferase [Alphaproteobacteria bacterium]